MTDDRDETHWPPAMFADQLKQASEEFTERQLGLYQQMLQQGTESTMESMPQFGRMSMGAAVFKTRVQSGGRISIPDAEREALDIEEGDLVQAFVIPIKRSRGDSDE